MKAFQILFSGGALFWAGLGLANPAINQEETKEVKSSPMQVVGASLIDETSIELATSGESVQCFRKPQHGTLLKKLVCRKIDEPSTSDNHSTQ